MNYHFEEVKRITKELNSLGNSFPDNGIVKTVLRQRIKQEMKRGQKIEDAQKDYINQRPFSKSLGLGKVFCINCNYLIDLDRGRCCNPNCITRKGD